ncbi:30S ribosomal protein S4 [Candidatus Fokinia solitaria]|uniref:Small ribosomal subunit protein uS4 n=2 Tax=Candidatus Fokinia solitaria TaxID=1802984 RepID=A0A2U8BSD6_9RICK|nr:30S ribosomal protein S4 [Candidatus Fokinia solitaria]
MSYYLAIQNVNIHGGVVTKINTTKCKASRRFGANLTEKADDAYVKRNYPPGMHGRNGYKRSSVYGMQLRAKQMLKAYYCNITEKQFRGIYKKAAKMSGDVGENLIGLLESRLDVIVYRSKYAPTMRAARQLVSHKHVKVNGKYLNVGSAFLQPSDILELTPKALEMQIVQGALSNETKVRPSYITFNGADSSVTFIRKPLLAEVPYPMTVDPQLTIELYSR